MLDWIWCWQTGVVGIMTVAFAAAMSTLVEGNDDV